MQPIKEHNWNKSRKCWKQSKSSIGTIKGVQLEPMKEQHWIHSRNSSGTKQGTALEQIQEKHCNQSSNDIRTNQSSIATIQGTGLESFK